MPLSSRSKLCPWIEDLVLGYGSEQGGSSERLKARVIRVEQMSQSQAQSSDCPTGLLLLSDGLLSIPAVLTSAAWERLQEQEDRDSFDGLVHSTVVIKDYRLQFHMSQEQSRCRFFLSVGELAMTSAGPCGKPTPCCTTLASVRTRICQTWRELLGEKVLDSQSSQSGLDLSMLLGEWHQDCMLDVLRDVEERLAEPSPPPAATGWDADRVRFKGDPPFSVPVKSLLIPDVVQLQDAAPGDGGLSQAQRDPDPPTAAGTEQDPAESFPPSADHMTGETVDGRLGPSSNPWDIFSPPEHSPCSSTGEPVAPVRPCPPVSAGTPACVSSGTQLQPEPSCVPPYQDPPQLDLRATAGSSTALDLSQVSAPAGLQTSAAPLPLPVPERDAKRRRLQPAPAGGDEEAEPSRSPPSWLFDTQTEAGAEDQHQQLQSAPRKTPSVHGDGRPFSYSYRVTGQNLQDLSRFRVQEAWLQWALRYLLGPEQVPGPVPDQGPSEPTNHLLHV